LRRKTRDLVGRVPERAVAIISGRITEGRHNCCPRTKREEQDIETLRWRIIEPDASALRKAAEKPTLAPTHS
jgi:hypothetical protein